MVEVGLVSCVRTKKGKPAPPKELYTSDYFEKMSSYAEKYHDDWYIISAKYGLLNPEGDVIEPYDETLRDYTKSEKREWSEDLAEELAEKGILSQDTELVIHAGKDYYEELVPLVKEQGVKIQIPTEGLGIGEKKAWYKQRL